FNKKKHFRLKGSVLPRPDALFLPDPHQDKPEKRPAQVSKMGYIIAGAVLYAGPQFDDDVAYYKPFSLDGNEKVEVDQAVGKHHAESHQYPENGARSAQHGLCQEAGDGAVAHSQEM